MEKGKTKSIKDLQEELRGLMLSADKYKGTGIHQRVYDLKVFSGEFLRRVKSGDRHFSEKKENRKKIVKLIKAYQNELGVYEPAKQV